MNEVVYDLHALVSSKPLPLLGFIAVFLRYSNEMYPATWKYYMNATPIVFMTDKAFQFCNVTKLPPPPPRYIFDTLCVLYVR
jgi:hypothetical protein